MEFRQVAYLARGHATRPAEDAEFKPRKCNLKIILNLIYEPACRAAVLLERKRRKIKTKVAKTSKSNSPNGSNEQAVPSLSCICEIAMGHKPCPTVALDGFDVLFFF